MLNEDLAVSTAERSGLYASAVIGYSSYFNSVVNGWTLDSNCNIKWDSVGVAFTIRDSLGIVGNLVVEETVDLARVVNISWQTTEYLSGNTGQSTNWAGYQFPNGGSPIWQAQGEWYVPSASAPVPSGSCTSSLPCQVSPWVGLMNQLNGGSNPGYIAQAGTISSYCTGGSCPSSYFAVTEFYPNPYVKCTNVNLHSNDDVGANVYSSGWVGGNPTDYIVAISDYSTNQGCSAGISNFAMGKPYWAAFTVENVYYRLPQFSTVQFVGQVSVLYGTMTTLYSLYNAGGWWQYDIWTCPQGSQGCTPPGTQDTQTSAVTSSSQFTVTWESSAT